jgi:hypothetical protein
MLIMLLNEIYLENLTLFYLGFYLCIGWARMGECSFDVAWFATKQGL